MKLTMEPRRQRDYLKICYSDHQTLQLPLLGMFNKRLQPKFILIFFQKGKPLEHGSLQVCYVSAIFDFFKKSAKNLLLVCYF